MFNFANLSEKSAQKSPKIKQTVNHSKGKVQSAYDKGFAYASITNDKKGAKENRPKLYIANAHLLKREFAKAIDFTDNTFKASKAQAEKVLKGEAKQFSRTTVNIFKWQFLKDMAEAKGAYKGAKEEAKIEFEENFITKLDEAIKFYTEETEKE